MREQDLVEQAAIALFRVENPSNGREWEKEPPVIKGIYRAKVREAVSGGEK